MASFIDPNTQYLTIDGKLAARSTFQFDDSGTNDPKDIFQNAGMSTAMDNPVLTNDRGELPRVWFDGVAKVTRHDRSDITGVADIFRWSEDPVQGTGDAGTFPQWSPEVNYSVGAVVQGSDGALYQSSVTPNLGNDPTLTTGFWSNFGSIDWDATKTYSTGANVLGSDGALYVSAVDNNLNNDPTTTSGFWSIIESGIDLALAQATALSF